MTAPTIGVYLNHDAATGLTGWMVDLHAAADAAQVRELFGTTDLPTPFLASVPFESVKGTLEHLNAGHQIVRVCPACRIPLNKLEGQDGWPTERAIPARRWGRPYQRRVLAVIYTCPRCEHVEPRRPHHG